MTHSADSKDSLGGDPADDGPGNKDDAPPDMQWDGQGLDDVTQGQGLCILARVARPRNGRVSIPSGMYQGKSIDCVSPNYGDGGTIHLGTVEACAT